MLTNIEITALKPHGRLAAVHVKKIDHNTTKKYPAFNSMYHIKVLCVSFVFTCYRKLSCINIQDTDNLSAIF